MNGNKMSIFINSIFTIYIDIHLTCEAFVSLVKRLLKGINSRHIFRYANNDMEQRLFGYVCFFATPFAV